MRFVRSAWAAGVSLVLPVVGFVAGCTSVLGIDENYVTQVIAETGGRSAGGSSAGGATVGGSSSGGSSSGGSGGSQAGGAAGACTDTSECGTGKKCCGGGCVAPSPAIGCSLSDCAPCPTPIANAEPLCASSQCSAQCASGYIPYEGACVLASSIDGSAGGNGGAGGAGGTSSTGGANSGGGTTSTGGTSAQCKPSACPSCSFNPKGPVPCCMQDGSCNCSWFNVGTVGYCL